MLGTLITWNAADGVGRIKLDSGEELRVGSLFGRETQPGRRVDVLELDAHPLGGRRATRVNLLDETVEVKTAPPKDVTPWLLDRIARSLDGAVPNVEVQGLLDVYVTVTGRSPKVQLFGVDTTQVARARWPELEAAAEKALLAWKQKLSASRDAYILDKAGRELGIDFLTRPAPKLRCEPLGTLDGLDAKWVERLKLLKKRVKKRPALKCLDLHDAKKAVWGAPNSDRLREAATAWEASTDEMFPRELAALASIADGLTVDGEPVIRPISEWTDNDDGVEIGQGSTVQGNLTLLEDGQLVDRDDDQVELHRFASVGALLDALLA